MACSGTALPLSTSSKHYFRIVSGYDRAIGVLSPAGANDFSSNLCVQTGSGAHPASCTMGTGGPFPGGKARMGREANHSPHLVPRSRMTRSYTSSPLRLHGVLWDCFNFLLILFQMVITTFYSSSVALQPLKGPWPPHTREVS
jgi:hypothetical protein